MNIAIIDDASADCSLLTQYLNIYFSKYCAGTPAFIQAFKSGEDFLAVYDRNSYDIIFIDYYMHSLSGMDTAYSIRRKDSSVVIIFTTVSRDFAIESYRVKASGYLVKPISLEAFSELMHLIDMKKLKERQFIQIINGYETVKIPLNNIIYCDITGHYVQIHTAAFGTQKSRMSFSKLCGMLAPYSEFLLCCRGCIINMNHIERMEDSVFFMDCGERIPFSQKNNNEILKAYSEFLFDKVRNEKL